MAYTIIGERERRTKASKHYSKEPILRSHGRNVRVKSVAHKPLTRRSRNVCPHYGCRNHEPAQYVISRFNWLCQYRIHSISTLSANPFISFASERATKVILPALSAISGVNHLFYHPPIPLSFIIPGIVWRPTLLISQA